MKCISVSAENPSQLCWVLDNQGHQLPGPVLCLALHLHRKPIGLIGPMGPIRSCKDSISYAMLCPWPISIYKSPSQNASAPMAGKRRTLLDIAAAACTPPEAACTPETSHNKSSAHRIPPDPTGSHRIPPSGHWMKSQRPWVGFVTVSGRRWKTYAVIDSHWNSLLWLLITGLAT